MKVLLLRASYTKEIAEQKRWLRLGFHANWIAGFFV